MEAGNYRLRCQECGSIGLFREATRENPVVFCPTCDRMAVLHRRIRRYHKTAVPIRRMVADVLKWQYAKENWKNGRIR